MKKQMNTGKYINPFLDWSFKHLFGRDSVKEILIGFLNALFAGKHIITDLRFSNTERQPDVYGGRAIIYDIFCTTDKGENIIVEMQNKEHKNFKDRALYYMSQAVVDQVKSGDSCYDLDAVYGIFFLNFNLKDLVKNDTDNSLTEVALVNTETGAIFNPNFKQYYIELPRFNKSAEECSSDYDKWIYTLKHMESLDYLPFTEDRNRAFALLEETAARANLTKEERAIYEEQWKNFNDYYGTLDYAKEEGERKGFDKGFEQGIEQGVKQGIEQGVKQGIEQGIEQGSKAEKIKLAIKLKSKGLDISAIAELTELTEEEIAKIV